MTNENQGLKEIFEDTIENIPTDSLGVTWNDMNIEHAKTPSLGSTDTANYQTNERTDENMTKIKSLHFRHACEYFGQ